MKRFGPSWDAPLCENIEAVAEPVGRECIYCGLDIRPRDRGLVIPLVGGKADDVVYHLECLMVSCGLKVPYKL